MTTETDIDRLYALRTRALALTGGERDGEWREAEALADAWLAAMRPLSPAPAPEPEPAPLYGPPSLGELYDAAAAAGSMARRYPVTIASTSYGAHDRLGDAWADLLRASSTHDRGPLDGLTLHDIARADRDQDWSMLRARLSADREPVILRSPCEAIWGIVLTGDRKGSRWLDPEANAWVAMRKPGRPRTATPEKRRDDARRRKAAQRDRQREARALAVIDTAAAD